MKIRGFLALLVLVLAIVYFLWIVKARKESNVVEEIRAFNKAKFNVTKANMTTLKSTIISFIAEEGRTPMSLEELQTFRPQISGMIDVWGTKIKYVRVSDLRFRLISAGKDRVFKTEDDIALDY